MRYIKGMNAVDLKNRLTTLRNELKNQKLDGFIVPTADEYQNEYVPDRARRLTWISGFTGSAGTAVILTDKAVFITDGRYTVQMKQEVPAELYQYASLSRDQGGIPTLTPEDWIENNLPAGGRVGYDPWLHTENRIAAYRKAVEKAGGTLVACDTNPLDIVWKDQPPPPSTPVVAHDLKYAGISSEQKRTGLGDTLDRQDCAATVLTLGDSIAWLLNIRGNDTPCTPFALSYAIAHRDGTVDWFIEEDRLSPDIPLGNGVTIKAPDQFEATLQGLAGKTVLLDPATAPVKIRQILEGAGAVVKNGNDPCQLPKACKNETEQNGMRAAHIRDGAAITRFLYRIARGEAKTELDAVDILFEERKKEDLFRDISFHAITGAGANGAIVHYRATEKTNATIKPDMLLLVDSGGQYLDGTTDITRTIAIGTPTPEQKDSFTRVLKGHIALATARFPKGTMGSQLDVLARRPLWEAGLDFAHGTGHGVGSYLSVHEGPQGISPRSTEPLKPGMVLSNEPGFYKEGEYGIRIENLVLVKEDRRGANYLFFETLTMAPIDRTLIIPDMLSKEERDWLNSYHARVYETLHTRLDDATAAWLKDATAPV